MGGEHERCNSIVSGPECDDTGTIEHAHIFKTGFWWWQRVTRSTIMRSGSNIGNPITHFSNPDIDFLNKATGQNNFRDNSRRFDENLCAVANIEQGISPPIASINGPSTGNNFTYSTWCASATDCGSPSYYWEYSNNGFSYSYGGSGSCYSSYLTLNTDLYLKVTVSCSSGLSDTEWRTIQYSGELKESITVINREGEAKNNHNLTPYGEIALFPNPSLGNVFVNFEKLNLDLTNTSLIATDIFGNMILSRKFSSQSTSDNQTKLYFETPGLYFITLISDSKRYISKVTIIK